MKKIVWYIFILLLPFVIGFLIINYAYKQTNHWKSANYNAVRFNSVPENIKLCNLGTSHGCWGLWWEDYPDLNAFNFAVTGQSYCADLAVLKHFEKNISENAIVLIPISYHQIFRNWGFSHKQTYYQFLSKKEFPEWNLVEYIKYSLFPILSTKDFFKYLVNDISADKIDRFSAPNWQGHLSEEEMTKLVDEHSAHWFLNGFNEDSYKINFDLVCQIVDYCNEQNYRPVFITIPVFEYFNKAFEEIAPYHKKGFYQFISDLNKKYPSIPYWDYSNDKDFSPYIELFRDDDHLNLAGAKKFTSRIIKDLRASGYME